MLELITSKRDTSASVVGSAQEPPGVFLVRLLLGGLLITTAVMKAVSPVESATMAIAYHIPPLLTAAIVQAELALAMLLLFGCWPKRVLIVVSIMFGFFGAFSSYRGWAGYESCGCFGSFKVNPWTTATLDGVLLLLAAWGASKSSAGHHQQPKGVFYAGSAYAVAGVLAVAGMISRSPSSLHDGDFADVGGVTVLEPETWIGKPFPLASHLSPEVPFHEGRWTILIHHHDCPHCQEAVPQYERLATADNDFRVVLIETPPFGDASLVDGETLRTRLSDDREWFVQTPVEIQVDAGVVVSVSLDLPSIAAEPPRVVQHGSADALSSMLLTD